MTDKEKEISLSELLSTDFIIVDDKMVGTFPLDRINMISDVLKQQKEEIERLNHEADTYMKIAVARQKRIDKAIKYIEENEFYYDYKTGACVKGVIPLLNILRGDKK